MGFNTRLVPAAWAKAAPACYDRVPQILNYLFGRNSLDASNESIIIQNLETFQRRP